MSAASQPLESAVDFLNEAQFFGAGSSSEREAVTCVIARQGGVGAYGGGFALTPRERSAGIRVFTGELMTSASARHIIGEECCRVLRLFSRSAAPSPTRVRQSSSAPAGGPGAAGSHPALPGGAGARVQTVYETAVAALGAADAAMAAHILPHVDASRKPGVFCCGKCTVAFWRNLLSGGFNNQQARLADGVRFLRAHRDGKGGWHRFPFHYTLLALSEMKPEIARDEIKYVTPIIERRLKRKPALNKYAQRRHESMKRALAAI